MNRSIVLVGVSSHQCLRNREPRCADGFKLRNVGHLRGAVQTAVKLSLFEV